MPFYVRWQNHSKPHYTGIQIDVLKTVQHAELPDWMLMMLL